jgi:large subunit ribosomal protein L24
MKDQSKYQIKMKIKKGDEVVILAGKSKGEVGKVENIDYKKRRVFVAGKNLGKKHTKADMQNYEGGIIDIPLPLDLSNVAIWDPTKKKPSRVGFKVQDNKKVRFAKASGTVLG